MKTIAQTLAEHAAAIKEDVRVFIGEHSGLSPRPEHDSILVIDTRGNNDWMKLTVEGRRLQDKILGDYRKYHDIVRVLIGGLPEDSRLEFDEADTLIQQHVDQQSSTWCKTPSDALAKTLAAFDVIATLIDRLYSAEGTFVAVPDTNALIANPDFASWRFDGITSFEIVFTPTALSELDNLKMSHRVPEVREKAESVIRRIKELARRGDIHVGVPVVNGAITARAIAVEPNVAKSLPWLDANNNDDRFLATVIEITRHHTRSAVTVVTGDVNLQNKARFARIPFCEVPALDGASVPEDRLCT